MKFGLEENIIEKIIRVMEEQPKVDKASIFGSRAKGNYRPDSDIDVAVKGYDLTVEDMLKISASLDKLGTGYEVDLVDYDSIKENALREHVDRVGMEFYSRWKQRKLGDFLNIKHGFAFDGKDIVTEPTKNILVTPGNFHIGGGFKQDKFKYYKGNIPEDYILNEGDIVVTMTDLSQETDTLGYSAKIPKQNGSIFLHNQRIGLLEFVTNDTDQDFIYWLMRSFDYQNYILNSASGTSIMHTSPSRIRNYSFLLPPIEEQRSIAKMLSGLEEKIDVLHRQNKTLESMAALLFKQWFVEEEEPDWKEIYLEDLATITSSKRIFYSEYVSSGIPFYRSKEIIELRNNGATKSELFIPRDRYKELDRKFGSPKEGDILLTSVGTLGVAYQVKKSDEFYFKDGNLTWFKDFKVIPSLILYLWIISNVGQEKLAAIAIGSTQEALTIEKLKRVSFKIPPLERIALYDKQFKTITRKIELNQRQISRLAGLRDLLLPKLLSGEARIKLSQ